MNEKQRLNLVKNYLNVDFEDDDNLINALIESGEEYLKNAGVKDTQKSDKLYLLAISIFVHFHYIERERTTESNYSLKNNNSLNNIIQQLKY
mgnify:FL=1|jgi:uncharacterized phage protein (predicted DNA packaging)